MSDDKNEKVIEDEKRALKCGLVMPISAIDTYTEKHWDNIRDIIEESLSGLGFEVSMVSDANDSGVIQSRIVQNLFDSDIVICDVSAKNPNVMFELGMRLAFDKPVVIIKDSATSFSFDISVIEHLEYPSDLHYNSIVMFKDKLKKKVIGTIDAANNPEYTTFLKHFSITKVAKIETREMDSFEFFVKALSEIKSDIVAINNKLSKSGHETSSGNQIDLSRLALLAANEYIESTKDLGNYRDFINSDIVADLRFQYSLDDSVLKQAFSNATLAHL